MTDDCKINKAPDLRIEREIKHGQFLKSRGATAVWNWDSPAGQKRFKRRTELLTARLTPSMNILEVGCGTGIITESIAKKAKHVTAIDISEDLLTIAEKTLNKKNVDFEVGNAYDLDFPDNCFDAIMGGSILHHLNVDKALTEFFRVLKDGAYLWLAEPNMLNPQILLQKNIPILKKWLGDSPDETAFSRWPLKKKLQRYGFSNIEITPFDFLHPATPLFLIPAIEKMGFFLEKIPAIREIAGSLLISAQKL